MSTSTSVPVTVRSGRSPWKVAAKAAAFAAEADEAVDVHQGCLDALRESRSARYVVQAAYGGHDEVLDPLTIAVVREQLMYSSGPTWTRCSGRREWAATRCRWAARRS